MPVRGEAQLRELAPTHASWPEALRGASGASWSDAHTHMGHADPDGVEADPEEVVADLDRAGHARALIFPMHEPAGYPRANDAVRDAVAGAGGRLSWLCRVDPNAPGAVAEARRCLDEAAAGIKLHPRSDAFGLPHPVVDELVALAAARRAPVLFHAGRGIPALGPDAVRLAREHPDVRIILAHAGISDLGGLAAVASELPNLLFDTSWWNGPDLLALVTSIPPGQVLHASDSPYNPCASAAFNLRRVVAEAGLGPDALRSIAGAQLERVIAHDDLLDLGPAVGTGGLGPRVPALERVASHAATACMLAVRGGGVEGAMESLSLARSGCLHGPDDPHGELLDRLDELLALAVDHRRAAGDAAHALLPALVTAHVTAATPSAGVPVAPGRVRM